eukprot:scaffold7026_cov65-Phaeocystis_antarctica.AAC.11
MLEPHLDHHVQLASHLLDLVTHQLQGGVVEGLCIEERVLQYHVHLALIFRLEVLQALLRVRLEELADQVLQRKLVLSLVLTPGEAKQCHLELPRVPASELAQVGLRDGVVLISVPQRLAGAEVEEHRAKGPQVVGDIGCVHAELLLVHQHAGVGVDGLEKDLGHLGRAVATAGQLGAEALIEEARDVKVDQRPVEEGGEVILFLRDANDVERLEVGVDTLTLDVQVIEPAREISTNLANERPLVGRDAVMHQRGRERAVGELHHEQVRVLAAGFEIGLFLESHRLAGLSVHLLLLEKVRLDGIAEAELALHLNPELGGSVNDQFPGFSAAGSIDGRLVRIHRLHGDHALRVEADAPLQLSAHLLCTGEYLELGAILLHATHRLERHPRRWLGLGVVVVGARGNGGGGRLVEERAVVDVEAAEQEEGGLHRLLARQVGNVDGAAAAGVCEPGERGSGLDGLAEPVGEGGVGEDGLEKGRHRQRVGEQEGVQLAWGVLVRLDDEEGCVGRDGSLRRLIPLGAWGEGQLRTQPELRRQHLQRAAVEEERGEGLQLPDLRRQRLQRAAVEVEPGEALQLPELRRQLLQRAAAEEERGEGLQLPDLGRQHLQLGAVEVEPLDAVTAPRDAFPRAWALAIEPPLLQRRARRPHRPQRDLVRRFVGARQPCFRHDVNGAAAVGVGELGEQGSGLEGIAEPGHVGGTGPGEDKLEEGGHPKRVGEQEGVQLVWGVLARRNDEEAGVGRDVGLRRSSPVLGGAWGEGQLLAVEAVEPGGSATSGQPPTSSLVSACSCPNSGGSVTSRQSSRSSMVRARSCPSSGGSSFSGQPLRSSWVRARSCPIWGGSTSSGQPRRASSWTRSPLHLTPFHERGLSPSSHHSCSAGLAARIARSASSSAFGVPSLFPSLSSSLSFGTCSTGAGAPAYR